MKRLALVLSIVMIVVMLVPLATVYGGDPDPNVVPLGGEWVTECDSSGGIVQLEWKVFIPAGWKVVWADTIVFDDGSVDQWEWKLVPTTADNYTGPGIFFVPPGGTFTRTWTLYDPEGNFKTGAALAASCITGEIWLPGWTVYGILPPDPSVRTDMIVLYDTPVYETPGGQAIPDAVLLEGQTWFSVGSEDGPDGEMWYEMFVGSWNHVWVPAAALAAK